MSRRRPDAVALGGRQLVLGWAEVGEGTLGMLSRREQALLGPKVLPRRAAQFVAGRLAAQRALSRVGLRAEVLRTPPGTEDAGRPFLADASDAADTKPPQPAPNAEGFAGPLTTVEGAPALAWGPAAVSLSHSGTLACAVVGRGSGALGIDLEAEVLEPSSAFLEEAFAPGELAGFASLRALGLDPLRAAWTLKVWGVGLRIPLTRLRLQPMKTACREGWVGCGLRVRFEGEHRPPPDRMEAAVRWVDGAVLSVALEA